MFTGIVEQCGEVVVNQCWDGSHRLLIRASFEALQAGESIAVNGVCLTLLPGFSEDKLTFDVSPETLNVTTLGRFSAGDRVNLERALLPTTRLGGHYVSGHVDTTALLVHKATVGDYIEMTVGGFLREEQRYLVPKGSVTLDGVSLTIHRVEEDRVTLLLVPHTLAVTTLGQLVVGQRLNIEFDYWVRVVVHQLGFLDISTIKALTR